MASIALVDFEGNHGSKLGKQMAEAFRGVKHSVMLIRGGRSITHSFDNLGTQPDILYLYVKTPAGLAETYLDQLQSYCREKGPRPLVLCILENFFGAQYHFSLEQRGARVTYLQTLNSGQE